MTIASPSELKLDSEHRYWLNGQRVPGVTEILRGVGIIDPTWYTESARSRGTAVHLACKYLDEGRLDWTSVHPDLVGYVRAWEAFKAHAKFEILDAEQARYSERYKFAGTRDRRVRWQGKTWKLDLKTVGLGGLLPDWARYQLAAYEIIEPGPDRLATIGLCPDSTYSFEAHSDFGDAACFLSFLATFRRLIHHGRIAL